MLLNKYQGLGNDYFVLRPEEIGGELTEELTRQICHRHYGAGSDGILLGPYGPDTVEFAEIAAKVGGEAAGCRYALRILNPDGSEAEKSGNGLRIFAQWLHDHGLIGAEPTMLLTLGGVVSVTVHESCRRIEVAMGQVTFDSRRIPVAGEAREVVAEAMTFAGREFTATCASVGNPHCVVLAEELSEELARRYGPFIETDGRFPHRTNVQFMKKLDDHSIQIEIWERGAGYTLASGSSSSAAAAVAVKLGLCQSPVTVHMPGGTLDIVIAEDFKVNLVGPAAAICDVIWPDACH